MNTLTHETLKQRGSADVSYLGRTVDQLVYDFMQEKQIPGLTLAIVQAPYIPRVAGYGLSDEKQKRLASANTVWPVGPISQAFGAVAIMQLFQDGKLGLEDTASRWISNLPDTWKEVTILQMLRHSSGLPDYRNNLLFNLHRSWTFEDLVALAGDGPLHFKPGTDVELSATNFLVLSEIVQQASGLSYHDFITQGQIQFLGLRRTGFAEDLDRFAHEDISLTDHVHQLFKKDKLYIDPTEPAASYGPDGTAIQPVDSSALRGFSDIWASAQDISFWDIGLAGGVLIHQPEHRALIYKPWNLPDGREVPAVAGWQFYKHQGLMDIKGHVQGYSCFLSRFTDSKELVCVTLLANREGIDFTNLARKIAGAFGDLLSTNYDDNKLFLLEGQLPVPETVSRLEKELEARKIPVFAKFDHSKNAKDVGLELRPTTVVVFGSPQVGTGLMQADQSISLELPLRISIWEDQAGSTWLGFPKLAPLAADYDLEAHPAIQKMEGLLEDLIGKAGNIY